MTEFTLFFKRLASVVAAVATLCSLAYAQGGKLRLKAALVLTPEFCASKTVKGTAMTGKETYETGAAGCSQLESLIGPTFLHVTRVEGVSGMADADVALVPRFVDTGATKSKLGASFAKREVVVMIEWTVKDRSGSTVWLETVEGSVEHNSGTAFSRGKILKQMVSDAVRVAGEQSATKMAAAPELQKLAH